MLKLRRDPLGPLATKKSDAYTTYGAVENFVIDFDRPNR
jgi:hypothetical protein